MSIYGTIDYHLNVNGIEERLATTQKEIENARLEDEQQPKPLAEYRWRISQLPEEDRQRAYEEFKVKAIEEHIEELRRSKATATCQTCGLEFHFYKRVNMGSQKLDKAPELCRPCHHKRCDERARDKRMHNFCDRNPLSSHYL
jgi:hypothetical protein